ncbi:MAG: RNA polymerase sigma factor [Oscillospiraceae bacterium]|nr:RNA polymerase sigma factor [Oscillospiraceae bacterium]
MNHNIEQIVAEYADKIFGFCVSRLNNIDDARDLSQEILLEIVKSLPKSNAQNISAWIWKIARNRYARRFNNKVVSISLDDAGIMDTLALADDTEFFKEIDEDNSDELNAAFSAIHSLAQLHRDILVDYYVNELSYSEIANKHKLSVNTVKTRLFYGKQKLNLLRKVKP